MPWIRSASWDALWIQSALWLAPLAFLLAQGYENPTESPLDTLFLALTALFWIGHRLGSAWLAYATTAYRPLLRAQPVRFVVVPLAIALACAAILLPPDDALAITRAERVVALVLVDYLFVTWHFAAQHFGVLSLYRARAGRAASLWTRRADRLFALGVGGALVMLAEAVGELNIFQGEWLAWLDRSALQPWADVLRAGAAALIAAAAVALLVLEYRAPQASMPRVLYVLGVAAMVACALYADRPFLFVVMWATQHWLVATGLTTRAAGAGPAPASSVLGTALHAINRRPWALLLVLCALSVLLLPVMEVEAANAEGVAYGERVFGAFAASLRESDWVPALLALGFASGFLHYWLDRAAYRFSDPDVRSAARGLLDGKDYFTSSSSTSNTSVAFGGITPPAPRLP
jgi:hypothetical protein